MTSIEYDLNSNRRSLGASSSARSRDRRERLRRYLNVVVALVGIILTLPVMLLVALAVKLTSPGPVIYSQTRVGLDRRSRGVRRNECRRDSDVGGRPFTIYKFRTMTVDNAAKQVWAQENDPRVTVIGNFLRKTRLDELPQLFNVLLGDMNVVGPRPEQPAIFSDLSEEISYYRHRQRVRPGITGWAQINLAYDTSVEEVRKKVELDLEYIERQSVGEDLKIMAKTLPVMVFRKGSR